MQSSLQLLHNDVALSIQQGYSTLLGTKTGCPFNYYKVYSHLVRHGFRILRHVPPSVTDCERQIGLHHYLRNESEKACSSINKNPQSEASNREDVDVSNSSSESIISSSDHMDIKDSDFQVIKSDEEIEFKTKFHSLNHSGVVDNLFHTETQHPSNLPLEVELHCEDKGSDNMTALSNQTNNKANMEVAKNDEYSSLSVEIPKMSEVTINSEKKISEHEFCLYEKIEMIDDSLPQNKNCIEYVNGVKCTNSVNKQLNHKEIVAEKNIPEVGEYMVKTASCGVSNVDSNDTCHEVYVISDSSDDSEVIDVETIPEEHNFLSRKLKNNTRNNTELIMKQCKLDAECEIIEIGCGSVKSTEKMELNTSENADIIFVNEIKKPNTNRPQKRRSGFLKDCIVDVETDTLIRNNQVMPRKKVKSNALNCPVNTFIRNNKTSVINCEIVDVCHGEVKPDTEPSNVHFKAEKNSFYEETDVESENQNKPHLEDWQSILSSFPNFANSEKAVVKLPDPKFLPPNVTPLKTEYTLYFHDANERIKRPNRHQNYRQRGFGNCNSTYGLVGSSNMEKRSFSRQNFNPGLLGPCPQQFKFFMGARRYDDYYLVPNNLPSNAYNNLLFQQPFINNCGPYETGLLPCAQNQFQQPHFNQHQQEFVSQCDQIMERQFSDSHSYASTAQNSSSNCHISSNRNGRRERFRAMDEYGGKNPMMNKKNRPRFNSNRYFAPSKKYQPQMEQNYLMEVVNREWKEFLKFADGAKSWSEMKRKIEEKPHEMKAEGNDVIKEKHVEPDIGDETEKEVDIKPLLEPSDCLNIGMYNVVIDQSRFFKVLCKQQNHIHVIQVFV